MQILDLCFVYQSWSKPSLQSVAEGFERKEASSAATLGSKPHVLCLRGFLEKKIIPTSLIEALYFRVWRFHFQLEGLFFEMFPKPCDCCWISLLHTFSVNLLWAKSKTSNLIELRDKWVSGSQASICWDAWLFVTAPGISIRECGRS